MLSDSTRALGGRYERDANALSPVLQKKSVRIGPGAHFSAPRPRGSLQFGLLLLHMQRGRAACFEISIPDRLASHMAACLPTMCKERVSDLREANLRLFGSAQEPRGCQIC